MVTMIPVGFYGQVAALSMTFCTGLVQPGTKYVVSLVPKLSPPKNWGPREPGNFHGKRCLLPMPVSGGTNQIAE